MSKIIHIVSSTVSIQYSKTFVTFIISNNNLFHNEYLNAHSSIRNKPYNEYHQIKNIYIDSRTQKTQQYAFFSHFLEKAMKNDPISLTLSKSLSNFPTSINRVSHIM